MDVVIYKRHSADCKNRKNKNYAKCGCRMMVEGTANSDAEVRAVASVFPGFEKRGRFRLSADTRNWAQAAEKARSIERRALDIAAGVIQATEQMSVAKAVDLFMAAKRNAGLEEPTIQKLEKTTARIKHFCDAANITNLADVNLTHISGWNWNQFFNTTHSRITNQERVKAFFRYFHNAGVITKNPCAAWTRIKGTFEQAKGFSPAEYQKVLSTITKAGFSPELQPKVRALVELMRHGGLAIIDASTIERENIVRVNGDYRIQLTSRQKTIKKQQRQAINNVVPRNVGKALMDVLNGNPRYVFWSGGKSYEATAEEKREAVKYWQKQIRALLDRAGFPDATSHKFRHTLAIQMIQAGATFEDVAAALGNTVGVVAKFYSHEWEKVRSGKTDAAIKAAWKTAR
jgi:integrase/recombinase XerD